MPYTRQQWIDRAVEQPHRYRKVVEDAELVTLLPEPGNVVQEGTAITAARMNYIEKGIEDAHEAAAETADSATKLETARTVRTNLASTSAASFDGTANITPGVTGILPIANGGTGNTTGLAASATQLATARTVQTNLASTSAASFDGTANITPGVTGTLPIANGGTGNTSGLSASATQLATARTVQTNLASTSTASFNGTVNITPGVTGILPIANGGTGNTSGLSASTTQLATARTVQTNLASTSTASFNGTANITPGVTGTLPIANGGTGATTAAAARTALGLNSGATREILTGAITITRVSQGVADATITFSTAFSGIPKVTASIQTAYPQNGSVTIDTVSATGATFHLYNSTTGITALVVNYTAVY